MKIPKAQTCLLSFLALFLLARTPAFGQVTPSQDSFTNSGAATTNYGANVLLDVDGAKEIAYIQFNLASIPSGASVSQATLKLYVNAVTTAGKHELATLRWTVIFEKQGGKWMIVHEHTSEPLQ